MDNLIQASFDILAMILIADSKVFIGFLIIAAFVIFFIFLKTRNSEHYGQDASIRAAAGWAAGPNYGFDPVQIYANQIEEDRKYVESLRNPSEFKEGYCKSCS
jgi:hypothetical protein